MVDTVPEAVNAELDKRTEAIAATAAAQIEQANKDAEAIARAAQQSGHVARVNELEGRIGTWKSDLETRLATQKAELAAMIEASQASILSQLPKAPPVVVETPVSDTSPTVNPANEGEEPKSKSPPTEQQGSTDRVPPRQAEARKRAVL